MMISSIWATDTTLEGSLDGQASTELRSRFVELVDRELDRSYRLAGLLLGNGAEAEDAVGDALERAWREIDRLREPDRFRAWFDRIVVNACRDRLRRRSRVRFVPLDAGGQVVADPFRAVIEADAALRAMAALNPDERVVVVLHFWADLTLEAVAERLSWPVGTVKSRLHRALVAMRRSMPARPTGGVE